MKRSKDTPGATSKEAQRAEIRDDLTICTERLKEAMDELYGDAEPASAVSLVFCIRGTRAKIRRLLDEAERLDMQDPLVKRLRAAYPTRPAN